MLVDVYVSGPDQNHTFVGQFTVEEAIERFQPDSPHPATQQEITAIERQLRSDGRHQFRSRPGHTVMFWRADQP